MAEVAIFIFIFYFIILLMIFSGWQKSLSEKQPRVSAERFISIILPVRNEERNIRAILQDLSRQQYTWFEIIVVNDHSEDRTEELVRAYQSPFVKCVQNVGSGKKQAITTGVAIASGEIIATTDGDCSVPSTWLTTINEYLVDGKMMACGPVRIRGEGTLFSHMQQIEFSALIGTAASTLQMGWPTMCNGANLAYKKEVFNSLKGYEGNEAVPSGDDEFLMRKVNKEFPKSLVFMTDRRTIVTTGASPTIRQLFQQRLRWAAKWRYNTSFTTILLAFFITLVQICTLYCFVQFFRSLDLSWLLLIFSKAAIEAVMLISFCRFLDIKWRWGAFILLYLIYPFYVLFVALVSNIAGYSWRGRRFAIF